MKPPKNKEAELIVSDLETLFTRLAQLKSKKGTLWFGISGSWKKTNEEVEKGVRKAVRKIIERGDGIVSGGALNVDYFATHEALKLNPTADRIKNISSGCIGFICRTLPKKGDRGRHNS